MQHIHSLAEAQFVRPSVVTIGVFDGVHRGHQYLIQQLVAHAEATGQIPVVLTFYPHPQMVIRGFEPGFYLTLPDDRARLLGELGVELIVTHPFDDEVRHIRAADFVDRLREHLNMASLWVGEDFAMGYQREGNVAFLAEQGRQKGFELRVVDLMDAGDEHVSSTRIRNLLTAGDVRETARLLGRPHFVTGRVVEGARRGRTIGIPTANLDVPAELAVPARGVYAGWMTVDQAEYPAVTNVGLRPTFEGEATPTVEAHLLDFSGNLYGEHVRLNFVERLREEKKFDGVEALVAQIQEDIQRGRKLLALG